MAGKNKYKARMPRQDRGINTKEQVMIAAEKLFIEQGYHETTSKQIARHAGVSTGTFYSYFYDKKDVFIAVVWKHIQQTFTAMSEKIDSWDRSHDPREIVSLLIALTVEHLSPGLFREVTILKYHDPDIADLHEKTTKMATKVFLSLAQTFRNQLRITDLEAGIEVMILAIIDIVHITTIFKQRIQSERIINELTDMVIRYLFLDSCPQIQDSPA